MSKSASRHPWPATYSPGRWTALAGENTWLLLELGAGQVMRPQLWQLVSGNAPLEELVSELVRDGLRATPHFAMVQRDGDEAIVIVRGSARVLVDGSSEDHYEIDGVGVTTWTERRVGGIAKLELVGLSEADAVAPSLPLSSGVALAGVVRLACRETPDGRDGLGDVGPATFEIAEAAATDSAPAFGITENLTDTLSSDATSMFTPPEAPEPDPEPEPEPAIATPAPVVANPYDQLFEETQQRTVEDAAVRPAEAVAPPPAPAETLPPPSASPPSELSPSLTPGWSAVPLGPVGPVVHRVGSPSAPVPSAPVQSPSSGASTSSASTPSPDGGLIDATPWAARHAPSAPSSPAAQQDRSAADEIEETERTVKRSAVRSGVPGQPSAPSFLGPTVQAVLCPAGHLNPAHAPACRVCRQSLAVQDPVTVPRPVLGVLKLSTGDIVTLDRGVLLGRSPSAEFDGKGERPHVVRLPSPGQDISRTHAEIRIDGWHVLITDLDSTNGTMITVPGEEPRRLRPNDPTMIPPGTLVSLADEVSFEYAVSDSE